MPGLVDRDSLILTVALPLEFSFTVLVLPATLTVTLPPGWTPEADTVTWKVAVQPRFTVVLTRFTFTEVAAVPDQEARLATLTLDETPPPPGDPLWQVPNGTRTDSGAAILNLGHVDVASLLAGGELVTKVKDTTESAVAVWREPEQVVLQALPGSRVSVPDAATYRFLGTPGADLWLLPETQDAGLLWPGWSTEEIATDATRTTFGWTLTGVAGPGEFGRCRPGRQSRRRGRRPEHRRCRAGRSRPPL